MEGEEGKEPRGGDLVKMETTTEEHYACKTHISWLRRVEIEAASFDLHNIKPSYDAAQANLRGGSTSLL